MNLSPTLRWLLGGVAAVVAALAAYDPFGLPSWAQGVIGLLSVLFAALGIVPPQVGGTQQGVVNPSVTEPPEADVATGGSTYQAPSTLAVAPFAFLFLADRVSEGEALFWIGVLVVVGCLVAAAVAAFKYAQYVGAAVLVVIAIVAALLLL